MPTSFLQVSDNAVSATNTPMTSTGVTAITVSTDNGALFPQPGNGFIITLWNGQEYPDNPSFDPNMEKVTCTARSGDVLTITATTKSHTGITSVGLLDVASNTTALQTAVNAAETNIATNTTNIATNATAISTETTRAETAEALKLAKASNLSDVADTGTSRANIHVPALTPAACVVTTNVSSMSGLNIYDGYQTVSGDLVLLTGQTTASQNGLWSVASGSWTRPTEMATGVVMKARTVAIIQGTTYAGYTFLLQTNSSITIDTASQVWVSQLPSSVVSATSASANQIPFADGSGGYTFKAEGANLGRADSNPVAGLLITDTSTEATQHTYNFGPRTTTGLAYPVATIQPVSGSATVCALDIAPDAGATASSGNGLAWIDICSAPVIDAGTLNANTLRLAVQGTETTPTWGEVSTRKYGTNGSVPLYLAAGYSGSGNPQIYLSPQTGTNPNVLLGYDGSDVFTGAASAPATTAVRGGFLYLSTCAGAPTGVPAQVTSAWSAMRYDNTNHKIWVYDSVGAAWKGIALA